VRSLLLVLGLASMLAVPGRAQEVSIQRARELERRGGYESAAEMYRELLRYVPADVNALLGLERVLTQLHRPAGLTEPARAAIAADPRNSALYGVALRAWAAAGASDSVRRLVERWAALEPGSEAPYREWGRAALSRDDRTGALEAYTTGRARLGRPDALAGDIAQLATTAGDYGRAIEEWILAIRQVPGFHGAALSLLAQAPPADRPAILLALEARSDPIAGAIAAGVAARWGEPLRAVRLLAQAVPEGRAGTDALAAFLDELRAPQTVETARARAQVYELIAARSGPDGARWLGEAARAYADAGDRESARRVLDRVARDPAASPGTAASAAATLVRILIAEGRLAEADTRFEELAGTVTSEERRRLSHLLARGWFAKGELARAGRLLVRDSTVDGLALLARLRLFEGDLRGAMEALMASGPYAGERQDATSGAALLALLQVVPADSLPELGQAFLALERGDSAAAAAGFEHAARGLPAASGGSDLLLLAGRVRLARREVSAAERLFRAAAREGAPAPVAAGRYSLAELLARSGRGDEARAVLEQLIIEFPESATAPQARRLLDAVRVGLPPA